MSVYFYAVAEDLWPVLSAVESAFELQYVECGLFDQAHRETYSGFSAIASFGVASLATRILNLAILSASAIRFCRFAVCHNVKVDRSTRLISKRIRPRSS